MDFQRMLIPKNDLCDDERMYFNGENYCIDDGIIVVDKHGFISTDTYFNSLSYKKYLEYTTLDSFELQIVLEGKCKIHLCYSWIDKDNVIRRKGDNIVSCEKLSSEREKIILPYSRDNNAIIAYFLIEALEEVKIFDFCYSTNTKIVNENINLSIGICTYKREDFVYRNVGNIIDKLIMNENSLCYGKVEVIIADNGNSLDHSKIENDHVFIYPNKNYGGSGGFTRCIIETKKKEKYSHILLMDDDILLDINAIERTIFLLSVIKEEYMDAMIGGGMLILAEKYRQFESGAYYYKGMLSFTQKNADLRTIRNVIQNERNRLYNYNAWCYCCMPLSKIEYNNLPLPVFIHMDDVEYGVRNNFKIITMNGISVWHPFGSNQRGAHIVYYDVRNKLIAMSELGGVDIREYARFYLEMFYTSIFNYDYERTVMACRGIIDFCKGIDWFKQIEPTKLNNELLKKNVPWIDAPDNILDLLQKPINGTISNKILLKTYLFPKKKNMYLECNINDACPIGEKNLYIYNRLTGKCAVYKRSFKSMLYAKLLCIYTKRLIEKRMISVSFEWKDRIKEIEDISFWNEYLELGE